jgi:hypothetical protein
MLSVIDRSLCRVAADERITSTTLKERLSALKVPLPSLQPRRLDREPSQFLAHLLWLQMQQSILKKPSAPLQPFITAKPLSSIHSQPEDMLEHVRQDSGMDHESRPSLVNQDGSGASSADEILQGFPGVPTVWESILSEEHILGALVAPDDTFEAINKELLLEDNCFSP